MLCGWVWVWVGVTAWHDRCVRVIWRILLHELKYYFYHYIIKMCVCVRACMRACVRVLFICLSRLKIYTHTLHIIALVLYCLLFFRPFRSTLYLALPLAAAEHSSMARNKLHVPPLAYARLMTGRL
jgi:hypothetical protein